MTINITDNKSLVQALSLGLDKLDRLLDSPKNNMHNILACVRALNEIVSDSPARFSDTLISISEPVYNRLTKIFSLQPYNNISIYTEFNDVVLSIYGDVGQVVYKKLFNIYKDDLSLDFMRELVNDIEYARNKTIQDLASDPSIE